MTDDIDTVELNPGDMITKQLLSKKITIYIKTLSID